MFFVVGNFSLHPDRAEACLKQAANGASQLGDGEHLGKVGKEIGHGRRKRPTSNVQCPTSNAQRKAGQRFFRWTLNVERWTFSPRPQCLRRPVHSANVNQTTRSA